LAAKGEFQRFLVFLQTYDRFEFIIDCVIELLRSLDNMPIDVLIQVRLELRIEFFVQFASHTNNFQRRSIPA
jgi:hypothetical protein